MKIETIGANELSVFLEVSSSYIRKILSNMSDTQQRISGVYKNETGWQIPPKALKYEPLLKLSIKKDKDYLDLNEWIYNKYYMRPVKVITISKDEWDKKKP